MLEKNNSYLEVANLSKSFGTFEAIKNISISIEEGEFVCFLGPSGCGKTTLLRCIAGLEIQSTGSVFQKNKDISNLPPSNRDFGIVFQSYALFPNLSVFSNISYGLINNKWKKADVKNRVEELLNLVNLIEHSSKYLKNSNKFFIFDTNCWYKCYDKLILILTFIFQKSFYVRKK